MAVDLVVIGGGTLGAAIAYGLVQRGMRVTMLDGGDREARAAVANFGLVWCQGKGLGMPAYQRLTRDGISRWRRFGADLAGVASMDLEYENEGGLTLCLGEAELEARHAKLQRLHGELGSNRPDWEMLDPAQLARRYPGVRFGPEVSGASLGHCDGHVNPLRLLAALHAAVIRGGGDIRRGFMVDRIVAEPGGGFTISAGDERISAERVVIAAGLGTRMLAAQIGLNIPVRAERGQILVTEKLEPFLPLPTNGLRQTRDGTVMIGTTNEKTGQDLATTTTRAAAALSARAVRSIPALAAATLVRQWAGLRILTPDGYPIYTQSTEHPGAFVAVCHSGVTLAALHATVLAEGIAHGSLPADLVPFHQRRFDVPKAA